jgi:transposase-like protein
MKETLRHIKAFDYYYSLGEEKSLTSVARKFNVSKQTVTKWNKSFNWQHRVEQRDIENGKELEKKTNNAIVNSKADYRALIKKTVDEYKERLRLGRIKISRPQDLESLAKLDLLMMGEATDINKVNTFSDWVQQVNQKKKDE